MSEKLIESIQNQNDKKFERIDDDFNKLIKSIEKLSDNIASLTVENQKFHETTKRIFDRIDSMEAELSEHRERIRENENKVIANETTKTLIGSMAKIILTAIVTGIGFTIGFYIKNQ